MQDATLEVESNILATDKLRGKDDKDMGKDRSENLTSGSSITPTQTDEMAKLLKSLSTRMEKIELEGKKSYRNSKNTISSKEIRETRTEMIRKSKILSKITWLLMKM